MPLLPHSLSCFPVATMNIQCSEATSEDWRRIDQHRFMDQRAVHQNPTSASPLYVVHSTSAALFPFPNLSLFPAKKIFLKWRNLPAELVVARAPFCVRCHHEHSVNNSVGFKTSREGVLPCARQVNVKSNPTSSPYDYQHWLSSSWILLDTWIPTWKGINMSPDNKVGSVIGDQEQYVWHTKVRQSSSEAKIHSVQTFKRNQWLLITFFCVYTYMYSVNNTFL